MAEKALITRRAAFVGALASTAALAIPAIAAVERRRTEQEIDHGVTSLARKFVDDAKAIDPSIRGAWVGNDMLPEHRGKLMSVFFDRGDGHRLTQKSEPTKTPSALGGLIKAHKEAWACFNDSVNAADTMHPTYGGAKAKALWSRHSAAENRALDRLLAYRPANVGEHRAKSSYLLAGIARAGIDLSPAQLKVLLAAAI